MKKNFRQGGQWLAVGLALIMTCTACAFIKETKERLMPSPAPAVQAESQARSPKKIPPFIHTVNWRGESLSIVAAWYTGDLENWKALAQVNPHLDPNLIFKGNKIVIPRDLLKTREPMPQDFLDKYIPKSEREKPLKVKEPEETTPYIHTVRWPDESLSLIAKWYTGNLENWKALAQVNPDINPDRIVKGDAILIPQNLLKTRDPMPQQFVKTSQPQPQPPPAEEKELPLFGPR